MENHTGKERGEPSHSLEIVVRTLRHEVGDLLQSVYSAVAILQERLPRGQSLERTILADLRGRAEICRNELDATHDLVCPIRLNPDWVELGELITSLAASYSLRHPAIGIVCDAPRPVKVWADAQRLGQVVTMLFTSLSQAAHSKIRIRALLAERGDSAQLIFQCDGSTNSAEQLSWFQSPFHTTRHARFGLGLALARRVIEMHGGQASIAEDPERGFQIVLDLPLGPGKI